VVFPGLIPHVARGVSRTCPMLRITLMFKTRLVLRGSPATSTALS
jgi:SM-20-related protein